MAAEAMTSKRILITGAAGFIGFHLAQRLKARGDAVVGLDNFNSYYPPLLKRNRKKILEDKEINVIEGDLNDPGMLDALLDKNGTTHLVHLAAQAGVRYSLVNPQAYVQANINGFLNVLEACRKHPGVKLTYASSSSVYGTNEKIPFAIGDRTDKQANFYGVTKKANELMAHAYNNMYGIPATGLRFFTVYGPWGRPDMAYFSFAKAILQGTPIDVYNNGKMRRDFTYVDDIIDGTVAAIDYGADWELFNLGNNRPEPLPALIGALEQALGKQAVIRHLPMQTGEVEETFADIEHSKQTLGFSPKVSLKEGIGRFAEWFLFYFPNIT